MGWIYDPTENDPYRGLRNDVIVWGDVCPQTNGRPSPLYRIELSDGIALEGPSR